MGESQAVAEEGESKPTKPSRWEGESAGSARLHPDLVFVSCGDARSHMCTQEHGPNTPVLMHTQVHTHEHTCMFIHTQV